MQRKSSTRSTMVLGVSDDSGIRDSLYSPPSHRAPPSYPPDTGQMTATSSPPFSTTSSGFSTISASTLHSLDSSTLSNPVPGCREIKSAGNDESLNGSDDGRVIFSEVSFVAVEAAAKYNTVISGWDMVVACKASTVTQIYRPSPACRRYRSMSSYTLYCTYRYSCLSLPDTN